MSETSYPRAADPIASHIQEFAAQHGVHGGELGRLWAGLRDRGMRYPGLAFASWAESTSVLGGLLTPILTNCPDIATMLGDLERFHPLFERDRIVVAVRDSSTSVTLQTQQGGPAGPDTVDACFGLLCRLVVRLASTSAHPVIVTLHRAEPETAEACAAFQAAFGTVAFGQPADRCVFAPDSLRAPITHADPVVRSILRPYAERRTDHRSRPWSAAVSELMTAGHTRLPDVARALLLSTRTLQMRLADEGRTFAGLLDAAQHDTALALLAQPHLPITGIAGAAGFATPSAFARAVRRWTGMTPSQYRASQQDGDSR